MKKNEHPTYVTISICSLYFLEPDKRDGGDERDLACSFIFLGVGEILSAAPRALQ